MAMNRRDRPFYRTENSLKFAEKSGLNPGPTNHLRVTFPIIEAAPVALINECPQWMLVGHQNSIANIQAHGPMRKKRGNSVGRIILEKVRYVSSSLCRFLTAQLQK